MRKAVFRELDAVAPPEALLASNTSSIPIAELAAATTRPDQVLGLHFFSPVPVMKLVEIVVALQTADDRRGMRLGCGHPMGPLTLSDFVGLDVVAAVGDSLYEEFRPEHAPPPLLRRVIAAGRLGRKTGHGFYEY